MKNFLILLAVVAVLLAGAVWWSKSAQTKDPNIVTRSGLHWHPMLTVYVKGEKQVIPANIGMGPQYASASMGMAPVHTHDDAKDGVIHLEFSGVVRKEDITLGEFFKNWGKDINSFGSNVKMVVNGAENTELGKYAMHDGDKIELRYD